ncbi:hypothetical protein GGR57DRAFT_506542 [Xylariaceae sp. FL1272]|nr:hypothetical protein GGR57DRAFT_506542 [Xylariaceae sp. FL1272]
MASLAACYNTEMLLKRAASRWLAVKDLIENSKSININPKYGPASSLEHILTRLQATQRLGESLNYIQSMHMAMPTGLYQKAFACLSHGHTMSPSEIEAIRSWLEYFFLEFPVRLSRESKWCVPSEEYCNWLDIEVLVLRNQDSLRPRSISLQSLMARSDRSQKEGASFGISCALVSSLYSRLQLSTALVFDEIQSWRLPQNAYKAVKTVPWEIGWKHVTDATTQTHRSLTTSSVRGKDALLRFTAPSQPFEPSPEVPPSDMMDTLYSASGETALWVPQYRDPSIDGPPAYPIFLKILARQPSAHATEETSEQVPGEGCSRTVTKDEAISTTKTAESDSLDPVAEADRALDIWRCRIK